MDSLPFQISEELKTKNLFHFIIPTESSNNKITLLIYENQKYRPVIGSWGNVIGVHIFPSVDRRPFTNEAGNKAWSGTLEDIQPINGFKWAVGGWELIIEKGLTDDEGWQYARKWSNLKENKAPSDSQRALSFVRRRRWKRVMEINLESVQQLLPYELLCRVQLTNRSNNTNNFQNATILYVEIDVNDTEHDNGVIGPPHWFKDFTIPLTHLSPFKRFKIKLLRNGKLLTNSNSFPTTTTAVAAASGGSGGGGGNPTSSSSKYTEEISLAEIMQETSKTGSSFKKSIYCDNKLLYDIDIEWKIVQNDIFHIQNKEKFFSKGELQEMILSEAKLSQRLKEKIIMLSLALGNEKCHSLIREITLLMVEGQNYLDDLDLIEVLDDVNHISGGNEFEKVLLLLKDAENNDKIMNKLYYPSSIFAFGIFLEIQNQQRWNLRKPNNQLLLNRIDDLYDLCSSWFFGQPSCYPNILKSYHQKWLKETKFISSSSSNNHNNHHHSSSSSPYSVILLLKDEGMTFELIAKNISDYIFLLRILSIAKYYHQTGFYNKMNFYSNDILSVHVVIKIDKKVFHDGLIYVDCEDGSIEFSTTGKRNPETDAYFPLKLPFEYFDGAILSHSYHYSLHYLVEIKVLSATSFALQSASDAMFRVNIDTINGQHQQCDFMLTQESPNQPVTGSVDQTIHLLLPAEIVEFPERLEHFATLTFSYDQSSVTRNTPANNAGPTVTPPRSNSSRNNAVDGSGGNRISDKSRDKRVSSIFGSSNSDLLSSTKQQQHQQRKAINPSTLVKLGQSSIFTSQRGIHKNDNEFQISLEKLSSFRLKIFLKQFTWMFMNHDNNNNNHDLSLVPSDVYVMIYLADRDGEILVPTATSMTYDSPTKKRSSVVSSTASSNSSSSTVSRAGNAVFRSCITSKKLNYSWSNESIEIDSKQVAALELTNYLIIELWSKGTITGSGKYDEDHLLGESLIPINPYKFSNATDLDCLIHQSDPNCDLCNHVTSPLLGFGHVQVKLHTILPTDGSISPTTPNTVRGSARIRSNNLIKLAISSKPIQPTDCAWPSHIINHTEKTIDSNIFYFSVHQDGIHIQTESLIPGTPLVDKAAILEECMEKVYTATTGKLHLIMKYENIRLDDIFILNDNTLLVGLQFKRKMQSSSSSSSNPSKEALMKATNKAVFREIRFEFLIGPCLAEDIYVTIANKVSLQPLRNQLVTHVQSSDKELEESFYSIAKLFQDSIYETITNISTALQDIKASNSFDLDDNSDLDGTHSARMSMQDRRSEEDNNESSKTGTNTTSTLTASQEVIEETRQRQLERMKEMQKRLEEVESWNKILPRFVNTNTTATSLTTAIAANTVTSFSSYSYMHSCTLKLLYLKKATLMIYLWYLIEQSPINLNAEKHYIEASWILFDEIEQHVNSDIMDTEDLDNLIYRIKDMMMKLEKEIRYQILKAFRNTIIGIDISLDLSKCIYEKYITIISMLLGTLEYSELDWNARQQQLLLFQQQQQQQQKEQGGVRPSIEIRSSEYGGRASTLSTVGLGGADTASSLTKPNKGFVPSHKSYIISNPQKKRDLIKFIIINDNMFEEYCNAILISHHYNFNKRPLLSYCINFDDLLNKFSHILDENLLMWNHRIMKYFMNTREEESNLLMNTNSNGKGGGKNDKQQKEEDLLLLQTSKTSKPFYSGSNNRDSSSPTNLASSDKSKASSNTLSTSQLLPWDITLYFDKDHQKDLFISNIPETIQLQLNIEIGLKKITPMYLEDMNNKNNTNNSNSNELALLDQDEESLYRIDLMNNKIAQAIARSYITLASEFEKVLLSNLVQYPDAVMSLQVNSNTRISLLGSSDNSKNSNGGGSGSNGNSGINGDVDEKDEIICFLLSMINDSYRIIHTHVPQSMNLFMNDYYQRFRKQQQHRASRYASHGGKGSGRRGKSSMGRQSLSRHSIHSLGGDSFLSGSFMENNQSSLMNYESMNMITFKTSLKAMSAISRKAINDLTNQIFFHCDLKAYFLAGFDEFFGLRNTMTRYLSSNGVNNASASVLGGMNANYTRQQKLYSFVTRTSLSSNPNANSNNGGNVIGGDDSQYTTMDTLLATISEFFLFIKDHVNVSDLEKIFYLCMKKILLRYLLFLRDFHLYIDTLRKRMKTPTNSEIEKNKTKNNGSNSTNTTPKGTSKPFGGFFTHKVRPEKKKAAAATTNKDNNAQPTMKSIPENQEENTEKDRENEFSKDENIIERERKKREKLLNNNEENEIEVEGEEVEERNNLEEEEETSNSPLERQGSMFRRTNWFSLQNNPLLSNENYLEAVYETWMKDSKSVMKFYSEMKMKLFPQSFRPANYNQDESSSSKKSKFDDLDDSNNNSGRNSENNNNNNKGDEENIELIDDEKSSPYKQTITLLLNYLSHCIVLSRTDEYTNEGLINEFILNGFGITFPTFVLDPIKYHPEIEKLFKLDPAFMHFAPSIEMLKYQKKYMLSQITGEPLLEDDQLPVSMYSSTLTTMHLHNPMSDNGYGGNRMPMSICNIQICGLAVYHVMKYKNLFLKISMNDKRFMTSISPNTGDTPHWNDVFLVERIPITACKTITIELFAFKLRAFKVMREYKIGEATINLMEILRNETANIQESPNNYKSSSIFSSFSADKKSSNNNKKLSNQWDASNTAALDNFETESVISNIGNPHFNGFNHTAWYVIPTNPKRFFQRGSAPTRSSMINRGSSFSATRTSMIGGGSGRSFSAQPTATQNLSYIYALASKGPREDVEDPQLRITLKVHIL